ncbi:MAG: ABC transporter permease [Alphaproteobacteria bacterium]|nr:ABC transporter permease [Alphaproteobacteria bacterium]MDE2109915.1 ABC transporter permease [Alphaproteobacteria bacterium]MDE2492656.1 ABC transporter permease [Alphaproteobacteria bacterium]
MIRRILLVARQEFLKYVTRRGFLVSLLMVPLVIALAAVVPTLVASHARTRVITIVDHAGGYEQAIAAAAARDEAHESLSALADYAAKYADMTALGRADPALAAMLKAPDRVAKIKAFQARGGWHQVFAELSGYLRAGAPGFTPPDPHFEIATTPNDLAAANSSDIRALSQAYLAGHREVAVAGQPTQVSAIIVIPKHFAPGASIAAQYWTTDTTNTEALNFVHWALTDAFRIRALQQLVPLSRRSDVNLDVDADVQVFDPTKAAGHISFADRLAPLVPTGLAFLLFVVAFSNAALLLQSVIEEKSTRMIEVLLSCASPQEIMTGKLMGVIAVALVTLALWGAGLFAVASFFSHETVAVVKAGLAVVAIMNLLPLILLYFLCGLLIYSTIFLAIGAMANSLPDAQALMTPAMLVIMIPNMLLGVLIQDPNGMLATVISWIPIYTPFFMLVRLPFHPPAIELWLTAVLVILTTIFLIHRTGRIFANHVLATERPPAFDTLIKQLVAGLRRKPA